MKKLLLPFAFALCGLATGSQAATVDLLSFTGVVGTNSSLSTAVSSGVGTLATLGGTTTLSGNVTNLGSFEWAFTAGDVNVGVFNDYANFTTNTGTHFLSDIASVGSFGSTGWLQYTFNSPYTGAITFRVSNDFDDENPSTLQIRNLEIVAVSPVPEPETYALMLAGLGFVGTVMSRRNRYRATT